MSIDKKQLSKLLYYFTTFDGGVYYSGVNARFIMNMRTDNLDYITWVKEVLENVTSVTLSEVPQRGNRDKLTRLCSKSHPMLTAIRERVYVNNHKVIDPHMLTLMDAEALAIIFMADGGTSVDKRWSTYPEVKLHTKGFSYFDNMALSKAIYEKLAIRTTVNRHGKYYFLRVKSADVQLFIDTIKQYVTTSFYYKLERLTPTGVVI